MALSLLFPVPRMVTATDKRLAMDIANMSYRPHPFMSTVIGVVITITDMRPVGHADVGDGDGVAFLRIAEDANLGVHREQEGP